MTVFENIRGALYFDPLLKMAIRSCIRVLRISTKGWAAAEEADSSYDAGEWSGPAWADNWQQEEDRVVKMVARLFDISHSQLGIAWQTWDHNEGDCEMDALIASGAMTYDAAMLDPHSQR